MNKSARSSVVLYAQLCAGCHGVNMEGKEKIPSLVDSTWINGGTITAVKKSISQGIVSKGMPAWAGVLNPEEINHMAEYILQHKNK